MRRFAISRALSLAILLGGFFLLVRCSSGGIVERRQWPVYYELDLHSAQAKPLLTPGGYIRITQPEVVTSALGLGGLLVVRATLENNDSQPFYAYDLACPAELTSEIKLLVNDQLEAYCPSCKSRFSILYGGGNPIESSERYSLLTYRVDAVGSRLYITNL